MKRFSRVCGLSVGFVTQLALLAVTDCRAQLIASEISGLLADHNQVRSTVTPTAANMTRLVWDPALATVAQNWANQCTWAHNPGAGTAYAGLSSNTGGVGENIFVTTRPRAAALAGPNSGVVVWAAERASYTYATNSCAAGQACGHYTQLIWARTVHVGCAIRQCASMTGLSSQFNNSQFLVCNYNPAGNFVGQLPYIQGATGSQCPSGYPTVVDGLCSPAAANGPGLPSWFPSLFDLLLTND